MAKLKPFTEYYPVKYDYVTELPVGWQLLPNIAIFQERVERGYENEELLSVTIGRGVIKQSDLDKKDSSTLDKSKYLLVYPNDLVYSMRFRQGASGYSNYKGIVSPACTVLKPRKNIKRNSRYYYYMLRTGFYKNYAERYAYGIADGQMPLRYTDFKRMYSIVPPLETQNSIVAYLDKKNAEIDKFIRNKKRLIELFKEEINSIRDFLIKDIPKNKWKKIKYIRRFRNGYAFKSDLFTIEEGYPVIRIGDISETIDLNNCAKYPTNVKIDQKYEIRNGDILIALSGATTGKVAQIKNLHTKAYLNQRVAKIENAEPYITLCLTSLIIQKQIILIADGSAQENISNRDIENLEIPFPDSRTRTSLFEEFEKKCSSLFIGIIKTQKEIDFIKEYREALITDLVTGKRSISQ
jgi:type I restriction enzyme, S subunit